MATAKSNYKLKNVNGKVAFLLRTGKDFAKNEMSIASAQHIIDVGNVKRSHIEGYPINVDNKWYFEGEIVNPPSAPVKEGEE